jgi:hypothetical protein
MEWRGPTAAFEAWAMRIEDKRLLPRAEAATGLRDRRASSVNPTASSEVNTNSP